LNTKNPFTEYQLKFLERIRQELIEIRNPDKDIQDNKDFEFYLEYTKKYGSIPKLRFKPNTQAIKEKIMIDIGYSPVANKDTWQARRDQAAGAFDKTWDNVMFRLKKAGIMFARINELFTTGSETVCKPIQLIQKSINPNPTESKIYPKNPPIEPSHSYIHELEKCKGNNLYENN
jgi:hypothetical protein